MSCAGREIQMRNKNKTGSVLIAAGVLLMAAALFLVIYNLREEYAAGEEADHVLAALRKDLPDDESVLSGQPAQNEPEFPDTVADSDMEMPTWEIDGNDYIGVLEIPSLGLSLPIMSEWSYSKLKIAPCRYNGSAYAGNLTIAGHNYSTHFGPIRNLSLGEQILFTDMDGRSFVYEVQAVETLEPAAIEDMVSDEWDLTLFTCTTDGQARVAVRCLKFGD